MRGEALEPFCSRSPVPWGLVDIFIVIMIYLVSQTIAVGNGLDNGLSDNADSQSLGMTHTVSFLVSLAVASLITFAASIVLIGQRTGATLRDFGICPFRWWRDFSSGATLFALMIVPLYALQSLLQMLSPEPSHPMIKSLMENGSPAMYVASSVMAVIVAPIVEEFLFRVLLQGWLENLTLLPTLGYDSTSEKERTLIIVGGRREAKGELPTSEEDGTSADPGDGELSSLPNPLAVLVEEGQSDEARIDGVASSDRSLDHRPQIRPSWTPIVVSSLIFALAHLGHGTDPIPLFFFALGLGWLYQRTHRLWPSVVVHFMLNGLSMLQLLLFLQIDKP